jgi:hypothetical protein
MISNYSYGSPAYSTEYVTIIRENPDIISGQAIYLDISPEKAVKT